LINLEIMLIYGRSAIYLVDIFMTRMRICYGDRFTLLKPPLDIRDDLRGRILHLIYSNVVHTCGQGL